MRSLSVKMLLMLVAFFMLYGTVDYLIQSYIIYPNFMQLERDEAIKDSERLTEAIMREIHHLDSLCHAWASRDDMYDYVVTKNEEYFESNLMLSTFVDNSLNLIYICNTTGRVVWGRLYDPKSKKTMDIGLSEDTFSENHPLVTFRTSEKKLSEINNSGIILSDIGPMLIASRPILTVENKGPIRGAIILGRLLGKEMVASLSKQTKVQFSISTIRRDSIKDADKSIPDRLSRELSHVIKNTHHDTLQVDTTMTDINGVPVILLSSLFPRKISGEGKTTLLHAISSFICAGIIILFIMMFFLHKMILNPISKLTTHALLIRETGNTSSRLLLDRHDEIGILAREFDEMRSRLREAQKKSIESSFYSGMVEMSYKVFHNIRNSLSPIVGCIYTSQTHLNNIPSDKIEKAVGELNRHITSEGNVKDLIIFMGLANNMLGNSLHEISDSLQEIDNYVRQIEKIMNEYHIWSQSRDSVEEINPQELIHDSVKQLSKEMTEPISINLDTKIASVKSIIAHRTTLSQVFVNTLINSAEAIHRKGESDGKININVSPVIEDGMGKIDFRVSDTGDGMDSQTLERIFERRFSTKNCGGSGIGLHWSKNTVALINGRIFAESEGVGKGACFHIIIPGTF